MSRIAGCLAAILLTTASFAAAHPARTTMAVRAGARGAATSTNWAGYSVTAPGASFADVKGSWVEPTLDCATSGESESGFWVGLGGYTGSDALEQIGTAADCDAGGSAQYYAWYELVPAPPVRIAIDIAPGDTVAGEVSVDGTTITLQLLDVKTQQSFSTTAVADTPDLSSAEWIAEAPSSCSPFNPNGCTVRPLANFGTMSFSTGSAVLGGHTGPISDPFWTAEPVQLVAENGDPVAQVSGLSADGSSFTVTWQSTGGILRLVGLGFATTPQRPQAGRPFSASLRVAATNPAALAAATTSCSARIAGKPVPARTHSFAGHSARCVWLIPAKSSEKVITGTVTATARAKKVSKTFSYTIR